MLQFIISIYDTLEHKWSSAQKSKIITSIVLVFFGLGIFASLLSYYNIINIKFGKFFAIELAFSVLLFVEVFDLFFILTQSVADSVGKQFEIISLILIRSAFKELGHLPINTALDVQHIYVLLPIFVDAIGAIAIFLISLIFYKNQQHIKITSNDTDKKNFVAQKKAVGLFLILFFCAQLIYAGIQFLLDYKVQHQLFNTLYTMLIFCDILILILSLRYSTLYVHLFRYSSFALATVLLRLSLSAPIYINVLLSLAAGLFVLFINYVYNKLVIKQLVN